VGAVAVAVELVAMFSGLWEEKGPTTEEKEN
jgi:hypothetical protein